MLDLKIVEEDQYDLVPVPLPGRLMVFAGASGLMCRRNDGIIANYPDAGAGGGAGHASYITLPLLDGDNEYGDYPQPPPIGFAHLFMTPQGVRMMDTDGEILPEPFTYSIESNPFSYGAEMPTPGTGRYTLGMVGADLAVRYSGGVVVKIADGSILFDPGSGAPS